MSYFDSREVSGRHAKRLRWYCEGGDMSRPTQFAVESWFECGNLDLHGDLPSEFPLQSAGFTVCPTCDGHGKHVSPSVDANGIGQDEFDDDPDFAEAYFGGRYDVPCYQCSGQRVVQGAPTSKHPLWDAWREWLDEMCADDPYEASEARYFGY